MLLTAQLRENLRINTLVRRISVVTMLSLRTEDVASLEKWTEQVREFQSFIMKMHERAKRLRLSSTIAATLYSNNDLSRTNDAAALAKILNDLVTCTLNARYILFQIGEFAIDHLMRKQQDSVFCSFPNTRLEGVRSAQPIPVNPESAHQLWRQLGQMAHHGF